MINATVEEVPSNEGSVSARVFSPLLGILVAFHQICRAMLTYSVPQKMLIRKATCQQSD